LAKLELDSFGVEHEIGDSLRDFRAGQIDDSDGIRRRSAYFESIGGKLTDYHWIKNSNRTRSVNQYLTHWIYPYKGKFHPQMIRALLNIIGIKEGNTVLDPFVGSGTAAVESMLLGVNCKGVDVSKLCVLQSRVKTESMRVIDEIAKWKDQLLGSSMGSSLRDFSPGSQTFKEMMNELDDKKVWNFFKVAELIARSDEKRRKKNFQSSFKSNVERMLLSVEDFGEVIEKLHLKLGEVDIHLGDSRKLEISNEDIDGIITSPPYSIALDYVKNDSHALEALGYDIGKVRDEFIGVRGKGTKKIELYNEDLIQSLEEMERVLKPGKYCVIIIGNATYAGQEILTVELTIETMTGLELSLEKNIDKIIFGLYNVMQREKILIFRKPV
jgi:tRNA G10  N-methylase Trm11